LKITGPYADNYYSDKIEWVLLRNYPKNIAESSVKIIIDKE